MPRHFLSSRTSSVGATRNPRKDHSDGFATRSPAPPRSHMRLTGIPFHCPLNRLHLSALLVPFSLRLPSSGWARAIAALFACVLIHPAQRIVISSFFAKHFHEFSEYIIIPQLIESEISGGESVARIFPRATLYFDTVHAHTWVFPPCWLDLDGKQLELTSKRKASCLIRARSLALQTSASIVWLGC